MSANAVVIDASRVKSQWGMNVYLSRCFYKIFCLSLKHRAWDKALFFSTKMYFLFLHEKIFCGYSLEVPCRGAFNEYQQHMFSWRNKKNIYLVIPYLEPCVWWMSSLYVSIAIIGLQHEETLSYTFLYIVWTAQTAQDLCCSHCFS